MDLKQLIGDGADGVLPDEVAEFMRHLIEGNVRQFVLIAELEDGGVLSDIEIMSPDAGRFVMVGAIEVLKRDYMRMQIDSRVEYKPLDDENDL